MQLTNLMGFVGCADRLHQQCMAPEMDICSIGSEIQTRALRPNSSFNYNIRYMSNRLSNGQFQILIAIYGGVDVCPVLQPKLHCLASQIQSEFHL